MREFFSAGIMMTRHRSETGDGRRVHQKSVSQIKVSNLLRWQWQRMKPNLANSKIDIEVDLHRNTNESIKVRDMGAEAVIEAQLVIIVEAAIVVEAETIQERSKRSHLTIVVRIAKTNTECEKRKRKTKINKRDKGNLQKKMLFHLVSVAFCSRFQSQILICTRCRWSKHNLFKFAKCSLKPFEWVSTLIHFIDENDWAFCIELNENLLTFVKHKS